MGAASSVPGGGHKFVWRTRCANPSRPSPVPESLPLVLVCSVRLECGALVGALEDARAAEVGRKPAWTGTLSGRPVRVLEAGMGKTNAAQAVTALLEREAVSGVVSFGVGGAYPGSGLATGEVAIGSASIYADEGVDAPDGWMGTDGIGIPLVERAGTRWFNEFPSDPGLLARARSALGARVPVGPMLTVSSCSGTTLRGEQLHHRWGALCESMEGAAVAQVCALYGVPFLELRAVSNAVEDRDLSRWRLADAAAAAQRAVQALAATS